jgi:hypothetical protein
MHNLRHDERLFLINRLEENEEDPAERALEGAALDLELIDGGLPRFSHRVSRLTPAVSFSGVIDVFELGSPLHEAVGDGEVDEPGAVGPGRRGDW